MKIFISWSGATSGKLARALQEWLPNVIQALRPWFSSDDIDKGTRWSAEIAAQLKETSAGIICLTADNLQAPWIQFEAGALSKLIEKSYVCPYLIGLRPSDVSGPLAQFQLTSASKEDTLKLIKTLNRAQGGAALSSEMVERSFERWWPELQATLDELRNEPAEANPLTRNDREVLDEVLLHVRALARTVPKTPKLPDPADEEMKPRGLDQSPAITKADEPKAEKSTGSDLKE